MGRKNRRRNVFVPLDLTPPITSRRSVNRRGDNPGPLRSGETDWQRAERQRIAAINKGINWEVCLVPGCGRSLKLYGEHEHLAHRRNSELELPLCLHHLGVVWQMCVDDYTRRREFIEVIADVNERLAERKDRQHEAAKAAMLADVVHGDIYYVRVGGLIKVGWTRELGQRLKSYGAAAELLVSYPATRDDETNLHRQLRPALAKGREWYHDGDVIQHFIAEALSKYGPPETFEGLWSEPKRVVAGKRAGRR